MCVLVPPLQSNTPFASVCQKFGEVGGGSVVNVAVASEPASASVKLEPLFADVDDLDVHDEQRSRAGASKFVPRFCLLFLFLLCVLVFFFSTTSFIWFVGKTCA
jgi:hypothetical protein